MPYNGLGTFEPLPPPDFPAVPGELIKASEFNAVMADVFNGLSQAVPRDGQGAPTAFVKSVDLASTTSGKGAEMVAFKQAGVGAIDRTVDDKLTENAVSLSDYENADPTGVADSSAALQLALNTGRPIDLGGRQNTWRFSSQSTKTGTVVLFGQGCTVKTNTVFLKATDASGSRVWGFNVYPETTPYTIKRNPAAWAATTFDVVQSLEGYIPSVLDTDIWAALSAAIKTHNEAIKPGIVFDVSNANGGDDVKISGIGGRQLCAVIQGYSNSGFENCTFGGGSLTYGAMVLFNGVGRAYNSAILGFKLPRGSGNFARGCRTKYASMNGIVLFGQDQFDVIGNAANYNGESGIKTYQYDGAAGPSETIDVVCVDGKITGNTTVGNYYDGIDAQVTYGMPWSYVYSGTVVTGNKARRNRHTGSNCNGSNVVYSGNQAGDNGTHGIKVIGTSNTVTGNNLRNNCTAGTTLEPQVFDLIVQGDDCVSTGNTVSNPSAPSTWNYLHTGINGLPPTSGREGTDFGNYCDEGPARQLVSDSIPASKGALRIPGSVYAGGGLSLSSVKTVGAANYTVVESDSCLSFFTTAACVVTLPSAATNPGRLLKMRNTNNFAINSASANTGPLAGGAPTTSILPATAGKWVELQSNGFEWLLVAGN